jgi:hypothetical protein
MSIRVGCEKTCQDLGMEISTIYRVNSNGDPSKLSNLDGIIVIGSLDIENLEEFYNHNSNVVFIDYDPNDSHVKYDVVISDFKKATAKVLDYLFQLNHQNIGYIGGVQQIKTLDNLSKSENRDPRIETFEKIMKERKLFKEENVYIADWLTSEGYKIMKQAIKKGSLPTAFIIGSDPMAIGALHALNTAYLRFWRCCRICRNACRASCVSVCWRNGLLSGFYSKRPFVSPLFFPAVFLCQRRSRKSRCLKAKGRTFCRLSGYLCNIERNEKVSKHFYFHDCLFLFE